MGGPPELGARHLPAAPNLITLLDSGLVLEPPRAPDTSRPTVVCSSPTSPTVLAVDAAAVFLRFLRFFLDRSAPLSQQAVHK